MSSTEVTIVEKIWYLWSRKVLFQLLAPGCWWSCKTESQQPSSVWPRVQGAAETLPADCSPWDPSFSPFQYAKALDPRRKQHPLLPGGGGLQRTTPRRDLCSRRRLGALSSDSRNHLARSLVSGGFVIGKHHELPGASLQASVVGWTLEGTLSFERLGWKAIGSTCDCLRASPPLCLSIPGARAWSQAARRAPKEGGGDGTDGDATAEHFWGGGGEWKGQGFRTTAGRGGVLGAVD